MNHFKRISVDEADQILVRFPEALLLDIRDERSFQESHHPRAQLLTDANLRKIMKNTDKTCPVLIYCYHGNSSQDIARMFADFGFKQTYSVDGGYSAWSHHISSEFQVGEKLQNWLDSKGYDGGDINARIDDCNRTAIMIAARSADSEIVRELVNAGANPNLADCEGNNALWYACMSQCIACVKLMLKADAEVDNHNIHGFTPLNYSVGMDDIFNLLANYFCDDSLLRLHATGGDEQNHNLIATPAVAL
ncbi:ankyrin repeat domain-containing protein [Teredinibacter turnerae]|uniref:ankyrin repeat domain-containing protein n=1 Tax=Teredinibacter turnerae TaxID=2426 RepID=UPI00036A420A|nr:ankyrin repeat domain-containing protein [Teredinibacter turnerae]